MKIYKNPYVSYPRYFIKTGVAHSYKSEASKSKGYAVSFKNGEWECEEATYYNQTLNEMPVVYKGGENIAKIISDAIINFVRSRVKEKWY